MINPETSLQTTLASHASQKLPYHYLILYYLKIGQRFIMHSVLIFICQFIAIGTSSLSLPASSLYPPMGVAFVLLYLFGKTAVLPLCLVGLIAYLLQGLSWPYLMGYLLADIGVGALGAKWSSRLFSNEDPRTNNWPEWVQFVLFNGLFTSFFSAMLRVLPRLTSQEGPISLSMLVFNFINLWLADLTAIVVLFAFAIQWLNLIYSRVPVLNKTISQKIGLSCFFLGIIVALFMMKSSAFYVPMLACLFLSWYLAYRAGIVLGSALLYVFSFLYFAYFSVNKSAFIFHYGLKFYTLITVILFLYSMAVLYFSNRGRQ